MGFVLTLGCFVEKVKEERGDISRKDLDHLLDSSLECLNFRNHSEKTVGKPSLSKGFPSFGILNFVKSL